MSAESDSSPSADQEPTRALLLAQALETCIQAERRVPGSADYVIARQPAWARAELRRLVALAGSLDAVATGAIMSEDFRDAARARLMRRIAPGSAHAHPKIAGLTSVPPVRSDTAHHVPRPRRRRSSWLWRGGLGGLFAAVLLTAATLTASANALPGDPLYGIKQAREEWGVRFAPDDESRALALLGRADARLNETSQLLEQGRTDQVAQTTLQYDDAIDRATTTYVVTIVDITPANPSTDTMESKLSQQQQQLQTLLTTAPEPARAELRQALVATERSKALVAEPKPADRHEDDSSQVAVAPTQALEVQPTPAPVQVAAVPPPVDVVARVTSTPEPIAQDSEQREGRSVAAHDAQAAQDDDESSPQPTVTMIVAVSRPAVSSRQSSGPGASPRRDQKLDDVRVAPASVAVQDTVDTEIPRDDGGGGSGTASLTVPIIGRSVADDHAVSPSTRNDDTHDRVAQQPVATPQAVVAQQRSSSPSESSSTPPTAQPATVVAQTNTGHSETRDASNGDAPHISASPQIARTQSTSAQSPTPQSSPTQSAGTSGDDHHVSTDSSFSRASGSSSTGSSSGSQSGSRGSSSGGSGSSRGGGH